MLSAPTSTAPAASSRSISVESRFAGGLVAIDLRAGKGRKPIDIEQIFDREWDARERPSFSFLVVAASIAWALARARSAVTAVNAFSNGLRYRCVQAHRRRQPLRSFRPKRPPSRFQSQSTTTYRARGLRPRTWAQVRHRPAI